MSTKPTIVLIPGAWHKVDGYAAVASLLHAAGYPTVSVNLPSVDSPSPKQTMDEDIQAVRKAIIGATSRNQDVIVVGHSYAGVVMTQAVEHLEKGGKETEGSGGVILLYYLAAFVLPHGASLMGGLGGQDLPWWKKDGEHVYAMTPEQIFYNDMDEQAQKVWIASLRSFSYPMFSQKLSYIGYEKIPSAYLFCTKDNAIPIDIQKGMVQGSGVNFHTEELDASHSPFLSQPKATADSIRRAAGEKV